MVVTSYKLSRYLANRIEQLLACITVYEAKKILTELNPNYLLTEVVAIDWNSPTYKVKSTFNAQYEVVWGRYAFASAYRIQFVGGPPNYLKTYEGSIRTLVCDRLLYVATMYGPQTISKIMKAYSE